MLQPQTVLVRRKELQLVLHNEHTQQLGGTLVPESHMAQLWWNVYALPQEMGLAQKHFDKQALVVRLELGLSRGKELEQAHLGIAPARQGMVVEPELGEELAPVAQRELELGE